MSFLVVAYPEIPEHDFEMIQEFRKTNDTLYYKSVPPHFTFVFPLTGFSSEEMSSEIRSQCSGIDKIPFVIRNVILHKDELSDYFHCFLVPREGYQEIVTLHDKLYCDKLRSNLRLDIEFIPHIGIGNSTDEAACKVMVHEWNIKDVVITGTIHSLDLVNYENGIVTAIEKIEL